MNKTKTERLPEISKGPGPVDLGPFHTKPMEE
jgi:hypothetical protein